MRRRAFITLLGGAALALSSPLAAHAQDSGRMRRVAILSGGPQDNADAKAQLEAFRRTMSDLGWVEGKTIRLEERFAAGDIQQMRAAAQELIAQQPRCYLVCYDADDDGHPEIDASHPGRVHQRVRSHRGWRHC